MAEAVARAVPGVPTVTLPNWADGAAIRPGARDGEDFVVGYSGNLGRVHDVDTLLDAARRLKAASKVVHEVRCGTKCPAARSASRKARTDARAASTSGGSGSALKRKLCIRVP